MCGRQRRGAERLAAIADDRNRPREYVERPRIVLTLADRQPGDAEHRRQAAKGPASLAQGADRVIDETEEVGR
jgi:hypothetical protein